MITICPGMQAIGQLVEIGEPGRYPGQPGAPGLDGLHLIERRLHQLRERLVVLRHSSLGNRIHLGLGSIDDVVDIALRGVGHLSNPYGSLDQSAQDRLLVHDLGVVTSIGRHRNAREQRMQIRRTTDAQQLAPLAQLVGNGYRISRLAASIEIDDGVIDLLVRRAVEVGTSAAPRRQSAMASLLISMAPSTHCSASISCGGVRSDSVLSDSRASSL
jgi:hypothetical protein